MKRGLLIVLALALAGCGVNIGEPLPPTFRSDAFGSQVEALKTPSHTAMWMQYIVDYDSHYNIGWGEGLPDQAEVLARALYDNYVAGKCKGTCGQMAAMYTVAARSHGYRCGAVVYWGTFGGHAQAWIEERDGTISMTNNQEYAPSLYANYDEFVSDWLSLMKDSHEQYGQILDEKFNRILVLP